MRRKDIVRVVGAALLLLCGCGSSGSESDSSFTTGSVYETSPPLAVSTIAGTAGVVGSADGIGAAAQFGLPNGVVVSPDGTTLYMADFQNCTIRRMDLSTGAVTTLAGLAGVPGNADGIGPAARFNGPAFLATDGSNLFVTDLYNNSVRRVVIATGEVTTLAGSPSGTAGNADGTGTAATFNGPEGIAITPDGTTLYVADYFNNRIRKIVLATAVVTSLATTTDISSPAGIVCDGGGANLYVTDFVGNRIQGVVLSSGAVSTLAGSTTTYGSADGIGSDASFNHPNGIALLGSDLYVVDSSNYVVRKIAIATGAVTTVTGAAGAAGFADGSGSAARFYVPIGIATDGTDLYVADGYNRTLRAIR